MWKEEIIAQFAILSQYFPRRTEENNEKLQAG
jgi:hypothetical protein